MALTSSVPRALREPLAVATCPCVSSGDPGGEPGLSKSSRALQALGLCSCSALSQGGRDGTPSAGSCSACQRHRPQILKSLLPENVRSYQQSSGIRFETALGIAQREGDQFFPSVTVLPIRILKKGTNPLAFFRPKSAVRWASEEGTGLGQPVLRLSSGCRRFCGTPKSCGDYRAGNPSV